MNAHQKTVELRFRQWKGANLVRRVLGGYHEKRLGQRPGLAVGGDLMLFHRFQQRALCFWRGAVDLVGEYHLREHRAGMEFEGRALAIEHRYPEYVCGQQIAGELDALEIEAQGFGQRMRERCLAYSRQVFDQQMPACQQAGEREADLAFLAEDDAADLNDNGIERIGHALGMGFWMRIH